MDITKPLNVAFESLAQKANTREELLAALRSKNFSQVVIEKTMDRLEELNMIGDHAVADQVLRRYPDRGDTWQMMKLRMRGVSEEIARKAIANQESEYQRALIAAERKIQFITEDPDQKKHIAKLLRFLSGRGFSEEICSQVVEVLFYQQAKAV